MSAKYFKLGLPRKLMSVKNRWNLRKNLNFHDHSQLCWGRVIVDLQNKTRNPFIISNLRAHFFIRFEIWIGIIEHWTYQIRRSGKFFAHTFIKKFKFYCVIMQGYNSVQQTEMSLKALKHNQYMANKPIRAKK